MFSNSILLMKKVNDQAREKLIEGAGAFSSDFDKFSYICSEFLNNYKFDYSVLAPYDERERFFNTWEFEYEGKKYFSRSYDKADPLEKYGVAVSPSLHALKAGTCATFTRELEIFAKEFNVKYKVINKPVMCYDELYKKNNGVREMMHYYILLELDGEEYKIDVAGALMAIDYKKKNPDENISPSDFMFVDVNAKNPFDDLYQKIKGQPGEDE